MAGVSNPSPTDLGSTPSAAQSHGVRVEGKVETFDGTALVGWIWQPDNPSLHLMLRVVINDTVVASGTADLSRGDLERHSIGDGSHGFRLSIDPTFVDGEQHRLIVLLQDGTAASIPGNAEPRVLEAPERLGKFERLAPSGIVGWVWSPRLNAHRVLVELWVDGELAQSVLADRSRADLAQQGIGDGRHGFVLPWPIALLDGRRHRIEIRTPELEESRCLHAGEATFDEALFEQLLETASRQELCTLALLLADAGDPARALRILAKVEDAQHNPEATSILAKLAALGIPKVLRQLADTWSLWTSEEQVAFLEHLASFALGNSDPDERRVFPVTPQKELALDVALLRLWRDEANVDRLCETIGKLLSHWRLAEAKVFVDLARRVHPRNPTLLVRHADWAFRTGWLDEAEQLAHQALTAKRGFHEAELMLRRIASARGHALEAFQREQRGRSLASLGKSERVRLARLALSLGWVEFARLVGREHMGSEPTTPASELGAVARQREELYGVVARTTYALIHLPPKSSQGSHYNQFARKSDRCVLCTTLEETDVTAAPVIGDWAVILTVGGKLTGADVEFCIDQAAPGVDLVLIIERRQTVGDGRRTLGFCLRAERWCLVDDPDFDQTINTLTSILKHQLVVVPGLKNQVSATLPRTNGIELRESASRSRDGGEGLNRPETQDWPVSFLTRPVDTFDEQA